MLVSLAMKVLSHCMQVTLGDRSAAEEQELISWDEVKDQKEVYRAVRTSDGRQALVKAGGTPCRIQSKHKLLSFLRYMPWQDSGACHARDGLVVLVSLAEP